jgi:hypothetical protein
MPLRDEEDKKNEPPNRLSTGVLKRVCYTGRAADNLLIPIFAEGV